ncbi:ATP-binding protein [Methanobrevibacter filiformis]|uniref:Putative AAA-ATPase n=1 Tax=Methanobrevibacter filiformis TaxID=55758 RepID=A0A166FBB5_9EURY|nr:ATP-binding protein [Methanobrevibacter filiformis]KZX17494.1 putative AAA-ATPase [Methanobrevibacter filiformis]
MQKLPVGRQNFATLRKNNYLYVDKTKYVHKMIESGDINFLSRPRRFGKSLLLSTLKELFEGNKKLFEGLYIYDKWEWEDNYPVITIDLAGGTYNNLNVLETKLKDIIHRIARDFQVNIYSESLEEKFTDLISEISKKTNKSVVVLIDEYDKPIISNLQNKNLEEIQSKLGSFYEVLKTNDQYIKFIFLTGVSKFTKVSVFSKLNNVDDLTLIDEFNSMCGYTQEELEDNFSDYIKNLSNKFKTSNSEIIAKIKTFYNGYSWNGREKVYNPYSTLLCFKHGEFSKNWFNTGTPNVLADYPLNRYNLKAIAEPNMVTDSELKNPTTSNMKDEILLFQTGYLTINNIETKEDEKFYDLRIPNYEVKSALFENLVSQYSKIPLYDMLEYARKLLKYTIEANCTKIKETLGDYLSPIPTDLRGKDEKYYHTLIFMLLYTAKLHVHSEVHSYKGNADLIIEENDYVIIIEFKQSNKSSINYMINKALKQIETQEYGRQYKNKKIIKGAIVFKESEIGCKIIKECNDL